MSKPRKTTKHAAKQRYSARKSEAGEHVQVNVKFKTAGDVAMWRKLRERFPDDSPAKIARTAIKALAAKTN